MRLRDGRVPPAIKKSKAILQDPFDSKGYTHTHVAEVADSFPLPMLPHMDGK